MKQVSILIPVYNDDVTGQVSLLRNQCMAIDGLQWEIVVSDDGSTDESLGRNRSINAYPCCRLIERGRNYSRASNRNFLAREASYDTLIYIDSGLKPNPRFVENYVENIGHSSVVCGGIAVDEEHTDLSNLRCRNELRAERRFTVAVRTAEPYKNFHSGNFMARRQVVLDNPFREDITTYGYEDTLFGKTLEERRVSIAHIDNPVLFVRFENNTRFLEKTDEAIGTLYAFRYDLEGYSPLLSLVNRLSACSLLWLPRLLFALCGKVMRANLRGHNPSLRVFSLYRACMLARCFK